MWILGCWLLYIRWLFYRAGMWSGGRNKNLSRSGRVCWGFNTLRRWIALCQPVPDIQVKIGNSNFMESWFLLLCVSLRRKTALLLSLVGWVQEVFLCWMSKCIIYLTNKVATLSKSITYYWKCLRWRSREQCSPTCYPKLWLQSLYPWHTTWCSGWQCSLLEWEALPVWGRAGRRNNLKNNYR